jgi:hypothetical protein
LTYTGHLRCRFYPGSEELKNLGKFLQLRQKPSFQAYFAVTPKRLNFESKFLITREHIASMIKGGQFDMGDPISLPATIGREETSIELYLEPDIPIPISGFPRVLTVEDTFQCRFSKRDFCCHPNISLPEPYGSLSALLMFS